MKENYILYHNFNSWGAVSQSALRREFKQCVGKRASHMRSCISHAVLEIIYFYWRDEFARTSRLSSALLKKCHVVFHLQRLVTGGPASPAIFPFQTVPACWWMEARLSISTCVNEDSLFPVRLLSFCLSFLLPSLTNFKARLDGAVSNLGWREVSLPRAGHWNQVILTFQPKPFYDFMKLTYLFSSSILAGFPCPLRCVLSLGLMQTPGQDKSLILQEPSNAAAPSHWPEDKHCTCRSPRCPRTWSRTLRTPSESQM